MSELAKRLRDMAPGWDMGLAHTPGRIMVEAADEIERLRWIAICAERFLEVQGTESKYDLAKICLERALTETKE